MGGVSKWQPSWQRVVGFFWSAAVTVKAGGFPETALYFSGGIGDEIMASAVAHELKKRGVKTTWLFTRVADAFAGNSDLVAVPSDYRLHRFCEMFGITPLELSYPEPPKEHLIATMCARAGVHGEIALRPYLVVSAAETLAGKRVARRQIVFQTSSLSAKHPMKNKQWPIERFQAVADALREDFDLVQLGSRRDPPLRGCLDLRDKTSIREAAAIFAASHLFVGLVSGLMHLARAVDCRSVIVYGGREHPNQSGYCANENLYWEGHCSPCWQRDHCDYDRKCMQAMLPDHAIAAARRQIERYGTPLPVDTVTI
jgi:ADP-heptose:LPS heptosyltransferase